MTEPNAPEQATRRKPLMLLAIGALVVIAAAVTAVLYFTSGDKATGGAAVGDCVRITSVKEANADVVGTDCADRAAMFKVGKRLTNSGESCPTENYQKGGVGGDYKLCLVPNLREGECFAGLDAGPDKLVRADCGSQAELKVTKVIAGKSDESACGEQDFPMVYPDPQTTFCLGTP